MRMVLTFLVGAAVCSLLYFALLGQFETLLPSRTADDEKPKEEWLSESAESSRRPFSDRIPLSSGDSIESLPKGSSGMPRREKTRSNQQLGPARARIGQKADLESIEAQIASYLQARAENDHEAMERYVREIARLNSSSATALLGGYLEAAIARGDDRLIGALAQGLANSGTQGDVLRLREELMLGDKGKDSSFIIGRSLRYVRNKESAPILVDIVQEQLPGYKGAIFSLLNMGRLGINSVEELILSDKTGKVGDTASLLVPELDYDAELHSALYEHYLESSSDIHLFDQILARFEEEADYQ